MTSILYLLPLLNKSICPFPTPPPAPPPKKMQCCMVIPGTFSHVQATLNQRWGRGGLVIKSGVDTGVLIYT